VNDHPQNEMETWEPRLARLLPVFGHRNWIVVADSAYPAQSNPAIETIYTGEDHLRLLGKVLAAVAASPHLRARAYLDAELKPLSNDDAPGATPLRDNLHRLLGLDARVLEHERIISKLDESARMFKILVLKSTLTIPYASVFLELDCRYWNADAEKRLRSSLAAPDGAPPTR
jgi:hypothetical protein